MRIGTWKEASLRERDRVIGEDLPMWKSSLFELELELERVVVARKIQTKHIKRNVLRPCTTLGLASHVLVHSTQSRDSRLVERYSKTVVTTFRNII